MMIYFYLLLFIVMFFLLATTIYAGIIAAPFVPTPRNIIRKALEISSLKPGEKFYDIGSGDGRALIIAARDFGAAATGFELAFPLYVYSIIIIYFCGYFKKAQVLWKNFLKEDISDADVVFCWLTPKAYPKLKEKFEKELKYGARIVTFSSPLLFWEPDKILSIESGSRKSSIFLYIKE